MAKNTKFKNSNKSINLIYFSVSGSAGRESPDYRLFGTQSLYFKNNGEIGCCPNID